MIQHHIPTPPGRFSRCQCGREPRQIEIAGRSALETGTTTPCIRYAIECACGRHTAKYPTLIAAEAEWGPLLSQRPLALPAPVTRLPRRAPVRKEVRHG
jgi:hypothetical protein